MANRASITIYHSCDAPATQTLHHFKKGTLKRPRSNQDIHLPLPTEKVNIPRRHGTLETVLRCSAPYCKDCAATEYEGNELTLTVAKSHGITGVNLRPSRTAKTAAERLQDGLERGKWIFSRETSLLSAITQELSDRTQRFASFHPQAASFVRVLAFLRGVPMEVEISDSTPRGNYFEASEGKGAEDVPGLPLADNMPVGAFYGDFGKPTGSRGEEDALGDQQVARHRSSEEVVKPGQKGGEGDIGFPRLMPGSLRGSTSLHHHRQNVRTWPADGRLERRATTQAAPVFGGSLPLTQPQRYHHHHHHNNRRQNELPTTKAPLYPFPQHPSRWPVATPTTPTATGVQPLPPRPRDPNIMPTAPVAGGGAAAFAAEDLALNFANGLAADKRLLEDAGLVAQGRRKKVRV
ncbi:hypothetical protein KC351_g4166 [Hortaea werneckii]|nr:hypothetical protein KC351_g4166 [Hortaea werneckii]